MIIGQNNSEEINNVKLAATGIILAGGKNSRMKKNKAFLELEGRPLIERSLEILEDVFSEVIISSNEPELYRKYNVQVVPDKIPNQGPIGGLHAGLLAAGYDISFFVACDMPFLDSRLIRHLALWMDTFDVVVPQGEMGLNPLFAFYKRTCLPFIEKFLRANRLKIIDFYPECSVRYVKDSEMQGFGDLNTLFCNVNTPEEWAKVQNRH